MRIVGYDEFIRMPSGTIFAPYEPCVLKDHLAVKVDHGTYLGEYGWIFNGVMPLEPWIGQFTDLFYIGAQEEASFEIYDGDSNDAKEHEMFLVFEEADIDRMIDVLKWAKSGCIGDYMLSEED